MQSCIIFIISYLQEERISLFKRSIYNVNIRI